MCLAASWNTRATRGTRRLWDANGLASLLLELPPAPVLLLLSLGGGSLSGRVWGGEVGDVGPRAGEVMGVRDEVVEERGGEEEREEEVE